uniref:Neur_chan_memb domain-containing protein n=1 Tax=Steinernema glaseri TaxID=37863 RepID=A0A1I7YUT6_9BILA
MDCGSWSYQTEFVRLVVENADVFLGDFYDNQEWLLMDANLSNGTLPYIGNESFSMVYMSLLLRRQSFYYVFNLVFPTTLVSLVAVIGFHAPINATGRRESKFRLGIMTLLSMSVMLLMLVDEMKNQHFQAIPWCLRFLSAKRLFCCYVPPKFRYGRGDETKRNHNVNMHSRHSSYDSAMFCTLIPTDVNFTEVRQESSGPATEVPAAGVTNMLDSQKIDVLISLLKEVIDIKQRMHRRNVLPVYWERVIRRLENISLTFYLSLIALDVTLFLWPEMWY